MSGTGGQEGANAEQIQAADLQGGNGTFASFFVNRPFAADVQLLLSEMIRFLNHFRERKFHRRPRGFGGCSCKGKRRTLLKKSAWR